MPPCSFCGAKGNKATPLCQACGSLRYPIANKKASSPHNKLITSAAVAAAILTPGSLIVLAMVGATRFNIKNKK